MKISKVSPLFLHVYRTYTCLHLTPIKAEKHSKNFLQTLAFVFQEMYTRHRPRFELGAIQRIISVDGRH